MANEPYETGGNTDERLQSTTPGRQNAQDATHSEYAYKRLRDAERTRVNKLYGELKIRIQGFQAFIQGAKDNLKKNGDYDAIINDTEELKRLAEEFSEQEKELEWVSAEARREHLAKIRGALERIKGNCQFNFAVTKAATEHTLFYGAAVGAVVGAMVAFGLDIEEFQNAPLFNI